MGISSMLFHAQSMPWSSALCHALWTDEPPFLLLLNDLQYLENILNVFNILYIQLVPGIERINMQLRYTYLLVKVTINNFFWVYIFKEQQVLTSEIFWRYQM